MVNQHSLLKIAIDDRIIKQTGIARYTNELVTRTEKIYTDIKMIRVDDGIGNFRVKELSKKVTRAIKRFWWENATLPQIIKKQEIRLFHCTKNYGIPLNLDCPIVTTIQDLIPLALQKSYLPELKERLYYRLNIEIAIRRSNRILTISNFSRDEIIRFFPFAKDKVEVIYLGGDPEFGNNISDFEAQNIISKLNLIKPYILTIGGSEPRKNVKMLLKMYEQFADLFEYDLVIIGGEWRNIPFDKINKGIDKVHFIGKVTEAELVSLYKQASLFIFPSIYEGFGLPVLEAMSCGVPVIASQYTSLPEIVEQAGILTDPLNPSILYSDIQRVLQDLELQKELSLRGKAQVKKFNWNNTAKLTADIYKREIANWC